MPRRKPWASLIIAILVADLVFLRTLWAVVTMVSTYFTKRQDPLANTCETCARSLQQVAEPSHEPGLTDSTSDLKLRDLNDRGSDMERNQTPSLLRQVTDLNHDPDPTQALLICESRVMNGRNSGLEQSRTPSLNKSLVSRGQ